MGAARLAAGIGLIIGVLPEPATSTIYSIPGAPKPVLVHVRDAVTKVPLSGAHVSCRGDSCSTAAYTNPDGAAWLPVPTRCYYESIFVRCPGYWRYAERMETPGHRGCVQHVSVDVDSMRPRNLTGYVTSGTSQPKLPLPGARVALLPYGLQAVTDDDGWFEISPVPPWFNLAASHPAYYPTFPWPVQVEQGATHCETLRLHPTGGKYWVEGRVTDARTGEELMGANVMVKGTELGSATGYEGYYLITNLSPGSYTLRANYIGYNDTLVPVTVEPDKPAKVDIKLVCPLGDL